MDVDEFDTMENCCRQLIVWNPEAQEIIGGYRYIFGSEWEIDKNGQPKVATSHMFHFSDKFMKEYAPYTVELGRSFVSLVTRTFVRILRASLRWITFGMDLER